MSDEQQPASTQRNVLGTELQPCSYDPMTGYYRTGCCENRGDDPGMHTVCCRLTDDFLEYSKSQGNDLTTPMPQSNTPSASKSRPTVCATTS